jgi:hypothetical protein
MDIFQDSVVALAYSAQTTPVVVTSRTMVQASDYEPNAYFTTLRLESSVALPVRWVNLEAKKQGQSSAVLTWKVEGQANGDVFYIEHRTGDGMFNIIGNVKAWTLQNQYSFVHTSPELNKNNGYRIRHEEKNGKTRYSPVRVVHFEQSVVFRISPNPAGDIINVQTNKDLLFVTIYDQNGRNVLHSTVKAGSKTIDVSSLPKGVYIITAQSNGKTVASTKMIK